VARGAVVVAAWTGFSLAELRGLKWADIDFDKSQLIVVRTVWHEEVIDTKTEHRAARVHLLPNVIAELKKQRKQNPVTTWVFEGPHVFPLDLATLGSKIIKKTLQGTGVEWHGFTHSVVVSVRGCTTTGRQSKPLPRYSVTARVPK